MDGAVKTSCEVRLILAGRANQVVLDMSSKMNP